MFKNELHIDACMFIPFKIGEGHTWKEIFTIATLSIMQHTLQLIAHINYLTFKALQYSKWNLWGRKFCSNFAQRETLTNVHPAAAEAPKLRRCSVQSFCNILLLGHHHQPPTTSGTCNCNCCCYCYYCCYWSTTNHQWNMQLAQKTDIFQSCSALLCSSDWASA